MTQQMVRRNINGALRYHDPVISQMIGQFACGTSAKLPRA